MIIQTRSELTGLLAHTSIELAFDHAKRDNTVWKISFNAEDGTRVRLVKVLNAALNTAPIWVYEPLYSDT